MLSKLPRWIWIGAWALAFVAGFINVVGFLSFQHQATTHLTGTTSMLAAALVSLDKPAILHLCAVVASFLAGTVLSGILVQHSTLQLGRRYGVALFIESVLIYASIPLLNLHYPAGLYFLALACGLQNAMVSTYSGAVVRTTHVSGMFTDLGILLGHWLRGLVVDFRKMALCLVIISAFFCGGLVGAYLYLWLVYTSLVVPGSIILVTCLVYTVCVLGKARRTDEPLRRGQ